ncbi:hypothetical protein AAVH_16881, partial [Aphelenchoides avenae]
VNAIKPLQQSAATDLSRTLACRNRMYVTRGACLNDMTAGFSGYSAEKMKADVGWSLENLCYVEFQSLTEFCSNYFQNPKYFREDVYPQQTASHLFAVWMIFEQLLATVAHGRVESEVCLTDYNTAMKVEYSWMYAFYQRNQQWITDADGIARHTVENCSKTLRLAQNARRASLDDKEVTALFQLIIAYYERMFFLNEGARSSFINRVLRELHDHHKSTYSSYAERLATLLSILGDFHRLVASNREFYTLITLYRSDGVMEQKSGHQRSVLSFHDLRRSAES